MTFPPHTLHLCTFERFAVIGIYYASFYYVSGHKEGLQAQESQQKNSFHVLVV